MDKITMYYEGRDEWALTIIKYQEMTETYICEIDEDDSGLDLVVVPKESLKVVPAEDWYDGYIVEATEAYYSTHGLEGMNLCELSQSKAELPDEDVPTQPFTYDNYEKFYHHALGNNLTFKSFSDFGHSYDIQGFRFCPLIRTTNQMKRNKCFAEYAAKRMLKYRGIDFADIILEYRNEEDRNAVAA